MAFWHRKNDGASSISQAPEEKISTSSGSPSEEIDGRNGTEKELEAITARAQEIFKSGQKSPTQSPIEDPHGRIFTPRDEFGRIVYSALSQQELEAESYSSCLALLEKRTKLEERLQVLNYRIGRLSKETSEREQSFEDVRFEEYLAATLEEEDEAESLQETLDHNKVLVEKREQLKRALVLLAQLESSRASIKSDLIASLRALESALPEEASENLRIEEKISSRIEELEALENKATSDGESVKSYSDSVDEAFFQ